MGTYIVTCDEETASWIGNDVDSMIPISKGDYRMKLEELKAEAEKHGYTLVKKRERIRLKPCVCGHNRREKWMVCGTGFSGHRYVCKKCGFEGDVGSSEHAARIAWNEAVEKAGDTK